MALNTTNHHKLPQTTTNYHKPPQTTPQTTTNLSTNQLKAQIYHLQYKKFKRNLNQVIEKKFMMRALKYVCEIAVEDEEEY